jgi:hypothetical protein
MLSALVFTLALLGPPTDCRALCSCMRPGPVSEARGGTQTIFEGHVLQVRDTTIWRAEGPRLRHERRVYRVATVAVQRVWDGAPADTLRVLGGSGPDCGYPFKNGEDYVIFAGQFEPDGPAAGSGLLEASICSHTTEAANAEPIRAALRDRKATAATKTRKHENF